MHKPIAPLVMIYNGQKSSSVFVKIALFPTKTGKEAWQSYFPDIPFNYNFLDDGFNAMYQKDITSIRLFNYFTILSILIASLGLYGMALFGGHTTHTKRSASAKY